MSAEAPNVVEFPQKRSRIANVTGKEHCGHCNDEALVFVGTERRGHSDVEVTGPCSFCERGFRLEFGIGVRAGVEYENPEGGPWGREGFWRSRPIPDA